MDNDIIKVKGTVEAVLDTQTFPSGFSKRVLVINDGHDTYPQLIPVEFTKDKTALLDNLVKGQPVIAMVNLRGNEYNGKYYANIQGWKLDKGEVGQAPPPQAATTPRASEAPAQTTQQLADDLDSIPF